VILVVAELQRDGSLARATWEAVAAAQQLGGEEPVAVAVLTGAAAESATAELAAGGVSEVLVATDAALTPYTPDGFVSALLQIVGSAQPTFVVLAHTYQARDFVPMAAARLGAPLVTDVTGVEGSGRDAAFLRPMFQGKLVAAVRHRGDGPRFVTVQLGAFRADAVRRERGPAPVRSIAVEVPPGAVRQRPEEPFREAKQAIDLGQAERIVAVGRGIKAQEHIALAERLAVAMSAEVAASRPICDSGWLPMDRQIGSSGQTVAPKLYVALGISGAIQHVVGMKGARTIVAINKDAEAPIFEVADYGVVGDLFEIVPAVAAELEKG